MVALSFSKNPKLMELAVWSNKNQISKTNLKQNSFNLPTNTGDYTYEMTGHWGKNYANYDFEVQMH
jgi:hypothetical protein